MTMVRSIFEHRSQVWSPQRATHIEKMWSFTKKHNAGVISTRYWHATGAILAYTDRSIYRYSIFEMVRHRWSNIEYIRSVEYLNIRFIVLSCIRSFTQINNYINFMRYLYVIYHFVNQKIICMPCLLLLTDAKLFITNNTIRYL